MKKINAKINKPVNLGLSILEISKTLMYEFGMILLNQNIKTRQKYVKWILTALLFILKPKNFMIILLMMLRKWFDDNKRPLSRGMNKKVLGLMKYELEGTILSEFVVLRRKTYSYLTDVDNTVKKAKATKECVIKRILQFNDFKNCLCKNETILKFQQRFKNEAYCVCTEEINKIALSSNDDKRLQTFGRITTYQYGTNAFKVCKSEMPSKYK